MVNEKDRAKLAKIGALFGSTEQGEAAAARNRASSILARYDLHIDDIDIVLGDAAEAEGPKPGRFGFTFCDINNPEHMARWAAQDERRRAAEKPKRDAVIERYGSVEAALAPCEREVLLRQAVRRWSELRSPPDQRWTDNIAGWSYAGDDMPPDVRQALATAYPLPASIEDAWTEYSYWRRRGRELELVLGDMGDFNLDLPACGRQEIVRELLQTGLRAKSIADVLIRQRYTIDYGADGLGIEEAVLADLEHLADLEANAKSVHEPAVHNGRVHNGHHRTARDRRAEVIRLLSNVDTARLSDREIARQVGVSPQTVGNIRRRHEASVRSAA